MPGIFSAGALLSLIPLSLIEITKGSVYFAVTLVFADLKFSETYKPALVKIPKESYYSNRSNGC